MWYVLMSLDRGPNTQKMVIKTTKKNSARQEGSTKSRRDARMWSGTLTMNMNTHQNDADATMARKTAMTVSLTVYGCAVISNQDSTPLRRMPSRVKREISSSDGAGCGWSAASVGKAPAALLAASCLSTGYTEFPIRPLSCRQTLDVSTNCHSRPFSLTTSCTPSCASALLGLRQLVAWTSSASVLEHAAPLAPGLNSHFNVQNKASGWSFGLRVVATCWLQRRGLTISRDTGAVMCR